MTFALLGIAIAIAAGPVHAEDVWIDVEQPHADAIESGPVPLIEVRGRAGTVGRGALDLVIVLDASKSTRNSSGADLNSDGHVGGYGFRYRRGLGSFLRNPFGSSDPADSILFAELEAVRRLAAKLDPDRIRLGVVSFADSAIIHSSIGSPSGQLLTSLKFIGRETPTGRTNMAKAIRVAADALGGAPHPRGGRRDRAIVLLSDGVPTAPPPQLRAAVQAVQAALEIAERGIRIYTVGLSIPEADSGTLKEIAHVGHGAYASIDEPATIVDALPNLDLQGIAAVEVQNATTGALARATHVWRDGSFGAFVRLTPGPNELVFRARGPSGALTEMTRTVHYEHRIPQNDADRERANRRLEFMKELMRERTVRMAVEREMEQARERKKLERDIKVEVDE
ncbi:MAG: VWA domain-containing protein [bacterium]|nr:VWA domain-containing protein [bacterium]